MSCYISSNDNRLYSAIEAEYGKVAEVLATNRFPAVRLAVKQVAEKVSRRDKTGTRTFLGPPTGTRKRTSYSLTTYLTSMPGSEAPGYGALFQAALGKEPLVFGGGGVASISNGTRLQLSAPHGLVAGQAVAIGGEIRFVTAVVDSNTVDVNAPFAADAGAGSPASPTISYMPGKRLKSASIYDYWSPEEAIQRIVSGAAVDKMRIKINGDFHEFEFSGSAADVIDNSTFEGEGGLAEFPAEPDADGSSFAVIPGHLGQVWLGAAPDRFYTLTEAEVSVENNVDLRAREFGLEGPRCIAAGQRVVSVDLEMHAADDAQTTALYQAARQRSPIQMMMQLGSQPGQLFGSYMQSVVPTMPEFDDSDTRLAWKLKGCKAQGTAEDEIVIAFA